MYLSQPCYLSKKNNQVLIKQDKDEILLPIEDFAVVVLDSMQITLSSALLSTFADGKLIVITCDQKHLPNGLLLSYFGHSRAAFHTSLQVGLSTPLKKQVWKQVIRAKLQNQVRCLELNNIKDEKIRQLISKVSSGDKENIEARASQYYWPLLFGKGFTRSSQNSINAALNFAYSLVRSLLARAIVAHGLVPSLGVKHHNQLNSFNLVDDLFEPYRPLVDLKVSKMPYLAKKAILEKDDRLQLLTLLSEEVFLEQEKMSLISACEKTVCSYLKLMKTKNFTKSLVFIRLD